MIREPPPHVVDVVVGLLEEGRDVMVINGVVHDVALPPRFDEATRVCDDPAAKFGA